MTDVKMSALMAQAKGRHEAIAAFNVITLEYAEGIISGAERAAKPVILQLSENAVRYHGGKVGPIAAALHAMGRAASVPVVVHMDHVEDTKLQDQAEVAGFDSIMIDEGRLPYSENVYKTASATRWLHGVGMFVEAELGYVGGKDTQVTSAHTPGVRTDPQQAAEYVEQTGVDALAVAVGSSHAMTSQTATLDLDLITRLAHEVSVPLVLHGSSGVPDTMLRQACKAGITKVNIGTTLNVAFDTALRASLAGSDSVDPRKHLTDGRNAIADRVHHLIGVVSA